MCSNLHSRERPAGYAGSAHPMKIAPILVIFFASANVFGAANIPTKPPFGHPLIGKWTWTRSANNCTEIYDYRSDGTAPVSSGTEKTDNVFSVSDMPDANGFYLMTIKTTKDYGGKDCGDDESDNTGMESTNYILFNRDRSQYIACMQPTLDKCFGPLRRVR